MDSDFVHNQTSMRSTREILIVSMLPLVKVLCLALIGLILAHPKTQLVPRATFNLLAKLVYALFLPCMIFGHLGEIITVKSFITWWFIPVNVILSIGVGSLVGLLVVKICRPPPEYVKFTITMTAFGNTGSLPLAIVGCVCRGVDNPFGYECGKKAVAYVCLGQWFALILVYAFGYHMMGPPGEGFDDVGRYVELQRQGECDDLVRPFLMEVEGPGLGEGGTRHCNKTPFMAEVSANALCPCGDSTPCPDSCYSSDSSSGSLMSLVEPEMDRRIRTASKEMHACRMVQPPLLASVLAFVVGIVPPIKSVVFGHDAPLSFMTESLDILSGAVVPSVLLILGGLLAEWPNDSRLGIRTTVGIIVARLLILPLIGTGVICLADRLRFLIPGDQIYRFVALLQYGTPSSILLAGVASLRGYCVNEASAVLFWQHVFAVFSLAIHIVIYFKLLISYD